MIINGDPDKYGGHQVVKNQAKQTEPAGRKILLVEDNEINQSVAVGMLQILGYQVDIAANGAEAVNLCMEKPYDLILMDCHMPQMGGLEATRHIRDSGPHGPNSLSPIIALTADLQDHVESRFLEAGANDFIAKPMRLEQLQVRLSHWLKTEAPVNDRDHDYKPTMPIIDESVLDDIREMAGAQARSLIEKIVELYLQKSPGLIDEIHDGARRGDAECLFRAAHALKSSSANIGAIRVSEAARQLEKLGRDNLLEHVHPHLETLMETYEQARLTLKGRYGEA